MKNLMLASVIGLFSTSVGAQTNKNEILKKEHNQTVPQATKNSFLNDFPNATKVSWGAEEKLFEAEFKLNGIETSATYDGVGNKKEVESEIEINKLPEAALYYIKQNYALVKLREAAKIIDAKNIITFEAEISVNHKAKDLIFDESGNFIKEVMID